MIIRMTEDKWINFDNVEKIVAFDDVLKVFFDGYENRGASFYIEDKIEGIKVTREISRAIAEGKIANADPEDLVALDEQPPLIKAMEFNEEYLDE